MSELDVNDAFDDDITEEFIVIRQIQTISDKGRVITTPQQIHPSPEGVVVVSSPDDLQRLPDGQNLGKAISIYTPFRLRGPAKDNNGENQPDQIPWRGSLYEVRLIDDYSNFGRGFTHAIAVSIQSIDPPPFEIE